MALDHRNSVDCVYIDFSKAFDSVVHSKLLAKLASFGVSGNLFKWLASFLHDRTQIIKIGNCFSRPHDVLSGVPQGSVLGPLLFLLFINDIGQIFGTDDNIVTVKLFADDVKIYVAIEKISDCVTLQKGLDALYDWARYWQLSVSADKCLILHIGSTNKSYAYSIGSKSLPDVITVRDLGVTIDSQLKFDVHINNIVTKANQRSSLILRCFRSRDPVLLFRAFITYVRPLLEYCCQVWSPSYRTLVWKIESVQRRFTKKLQGLRDINYSDRLKYLGTDSLEMRRLKLDMAMFYNILHGHVDVEFGNSLNIVDNCIVRSRGHSRRIRKQFCRLNCRAFSFVCRNVNAWNSLPDYIVNSSSVHCFKRHLRNFDLTQFLI